MKNLDSTGTQIRKLREKANMPLRKLASALDIDQSTLSKIERNERKPNQQMIEKIAEIFKANKNELLVSFYSDIVVYKIRDVNLFSEILQVAEAKIKYKNSEK